MLVNEHNIEGLRALFAAMGRAGSENLMAGLRLCGSEQTRRTQVGRSWEERTCASCCSEAEEAALKTLMVGKPVALTLWLLAATRRSGRQRRSVELHHGPDGAGGRPWVTCNGSVAVGSSRLLSGFGFIGLYLVY